MSIGGSCATIVLVVAVSVLGTTGCARRAEVAYATYGECLSGEVRDNRDDRTAEEIIDSCHARFPSVSFDLNAADQPGAVDYAAEALAQADAAQAAADAAAAAAEAASDWDDTSIPIDPAWQQPIAATFHGYPCTQDCSGHEAGYEWAEENDITDPDDCGGRSDSFIEGCQAYAEESQ
jgi:hypothetical protein